MPRTVIADQAQVRTWSPDAGVRREARVIVATIVATTTVSVLLAALWVSGVVVPKVAIAVYDAEDAVGWFANSDTHRVELELYLVNRGLLPVEVVDIDVDRPGIGDVEVRPPTRPIAARRRHVLVATYVVEDCAARAGVPVHVTVRRAWGTQRLRPPLSPDARVHVREAAAAACGRL